MPDQQRGSGILTPKQREYLQGESDIEPGSSAERAMRSRIRQRIHDSILDFHLLAQNLEDRDREKAFDEGKIFNSVPALIAFLYLGLTETGNNMPTEEDMFADLISSGIQRAFIERGEGVGDVTVEIEIEMDHLDLDSLTEQDLSQLTLTEVEQLFQAGKITPEEFGEIVQEHGGRIIWDSDE